MNGIHILKMQVLAVAWLNAKMNSGKGSVNLLFNRKERMYRCRLTATQL